MQHAEHAAQLMAAGAYEDAARVWRMATSADPSAAPYHSGLGGAQAALGNFDVAQQSYERALAIQPRFAQAYLGLGMLAQERGPAWAESATRWLQFGVQLEPTSSQAWMLLGISQGQGGGGGSGSTGGSSSEARINEAVSSLRTARRLGPNDATIHWQLGDMLSMRGERRLAVESFADAIRVEPQHVP